MQWAGQRWGPGDKRDNQGAERQSDLVTHMTVKGPRRVGTLGFDLAASRRTITGFSQLPLPSALGEKQGNRTFGYKSNQPTLPGNPILLFCSPV